MKINNESFWKWLDLNPAGGSKEDIGSNIDSIKSSVSSIDYIITLNNSNSSSDSNKKIMDDLSKLIPRQYFLEIQYCAKAYGTILALLFPPLLPQLSELLYIEWLLYVEPGYMKYRDHLVHMLKVAFVGHSFLKNKGFLEEISKRQFQPGHRKIGHFQAWCESNELASGYFKKQDTDEEIIREKEEIIKMAFFLAGIFHDFGYGNFYLNLYRKRLGRINSWLQQEADFIDVNSSFFKILERSLPYQFVLENHESLKGKKKSEISEEKRKRVVSGFFRDCMPLNHSIASTFTILSIADQLKEAWALSDNLYIAFQLAAEAIMIHDMTGKNNWAHLACEKNGHFLSPECSESIPLALLLIVADELSIWERSRIRSKFPGDMPNANCQIVFEMERPKVKEIEVNISNDEIKVSADDISDLKKAFLEDLSFFKKDKAEDFLWLWNYKFRVSQR